jgi:hypothetical protein
MILATGLALAGLVVGAGCGGGDNGGGGDSTAGDLRWSGSLDVVRPASLPDDVIVSGHVENTSLKPVKLDASDLRIEDAKGRPLEGVAVFSRTWAKPIINLARGGQLPEAEALRVGFKAFIEPGKKVPLTVAWRRGDGDAAAARVSYGAGWLDLPSRKPEVVADM